MKFNNILLLLLSVSFALIFLKSPGMSDVNTSIQWMINADNYGIVSGYIHNNRDYPPLCSVILAIVSKVFSHQIGHWMGLKISIYMFLALTCISFYIFTKNIFFTSLILLALTYNSVALGYLDIYYTPFLILSLYAVQEKKFALFSILYSIACFIKWQPIIIAPFLLLYIINIDSLKDIRKIELSRVVSGFLPGTIILIFLLLIFGRSIPSAFHLSVSDLTLSGNALNVNWILTYFLHIFDPSTFRPLANWGESRVVHIIDLGIYETLKIIGLSKLMFVGLYGFIFIRFFKGIKSFQNLILYSLLGFLTYFMFNTGVHENHLYIPLVLSLMLFYLNKEYLSLFLICFYAANINMLVFYGINGRGVPDGYNVIMGFDFTVFLAAINLFLYLVVFTEHILKKRENI